MIRSINYFFFLDLFPYKKDRSPLTFLRVEFEISSIIIKTDKHDTD